MEDETTVSSDSDDDWTLQEWMEIANPANHHAFEPLARHRQDIESGNGTDGVRRENSNNRSNETRSSAVALTRSVVHVGESSSDYSEEIDTSDSDEEGTLEEWLEILNPANHHAFEPLARDAETDPIRKSEE